MLGACSSDDETVIQRVVTNNTTKSGIPVGISFDQLSDATTRMSATNTQVNGDFNGIETLTLIPFNASGDVNPIGPNDESYGKFWTADVGFLWSGPDHHYSKDVEGGKPINYDHIVYDRLTFPEGTSSFLVYGHGPKENGNSYFEYGSTKLSVGENEGFTNTSIQPKDISFKPEPILKSDMVYTGAQAMVTVLNSLINTQYEITYYTRGTGNTYTSHTTDHNWKNNGTNQSYLNTLFNNYVANIGFSASNAAMSSVLQELYRALSVTDNQTSESHYNINGVNSYYTNSNTRLTYRNYAEKVRNAIKERIEDLEGVTITGSNTDAVVTYSSDFPSNDLPDGICYIMYVNGAFTLVKSDTELGTNTLNFKIVDPKKFAYPAQLWYYANSAIKTTDKPIKTTVEGDEIEDNIAALFNKQIWEQDSNVSVENSVLNGFTYGRVIIPSVTAVALVEPLRYGTSSLELKVQATNASLNDNSSSTGTAITLGDNFPLTGVFVGSQHKQLYDFTPATITNPLIGYDKQVVTGIKLTTTESAANYTLVLPSASYEIVYLVLEFQNNSENTIIGVGSENKKTHIPPGAKFYMVGALDPEAGSAANATAIAAERKTVFLAGHKTTVLCKANDFKGVYPVVPDLNDPKLIIGLEITSDWHSVTPGSSMLK